MILLGSVLFHFFQVSLRCQDVRPWSMWVNSSAAQSVRSPWQFLSSTYNRPGRSPILYSFTSVKRKCLLCISTLALRLRVVPEPLVSCTAPSDGTVTYYFCLYQHLDGRTENAAKIRCGRGLRAALEGHPLYGSLGRVDEPTVRPL